MINGQLVQYKDEGKGPVVLMLHGWGASAATFDDVAKHLQSSFRVVRIDFPGFGGSPQPTTDWHINEYAAMTSQLVDKLGLNVFGVIGHSFGGRVIIKAIAGGMLHAERVVLIGAAGVKPSASVKKKLYKAIAKTGKAVTALPGLRALRPALRKKLYGAAGTTDYLDSGSMRKILLNTIDEDLLPLVHTITQPTLLIWGEYDDETPLGDAYKMMNELTDGQLMVIPDAGHFVYVDDKKAVLKELDGFLA